MKMYDSLQQAKEDIRQGWRSQNGAICPCCNQKSQKPLRQIGVDYERKK